MRIGCHAVLFTDRIVSDTEGVLSGLERAGCEGVEIGARFFGVEKNGYLKELLDAHHLRLAGLHVTILWTDLLDHLDVVMETVRKAVDFLQIMPDKNIILTGIPVRDSAGESDVEWDPRMQEDDCVRQMAKRLNEVAGMAGELGVQIHYHNHDWEFKYGGRLFYALLEEAPDVYFALDTGWAVISGWPPADLIKKAPERFRYVHLRDYSKARLDGCGEVLDRQDSYVDVGTGDMDYRELLTVLMECLGDDGWAVVEYEKGEVDFGRYDKAVNYVRSVISEIS